MSAPSYRLSDRVTLSAEDRALLKAARRYRRIRYKVLARRIGITPSALGMYLAGHRRPTVDHLTAWRDALSLTLRLTPRGKRDAVGTPP